MTFRTNPPNAYFHLFLKLFSEPLAKTNMNTIIKYRTTNNNTSSPKRSRGQGVKRAAVKSEFYEETSIKSTSKEPEPTSYNNNNQLGNIIESSHFYNSNLVNSNQTKANSFEFIHSDQSSDLHVNAECHASDNLILDLELDHVGDYYSQGDVSFIHYEYNIS